MRIALSLSTLLHMAPIVLFLFATGTGAPSPKDGGQGSTQPDGNIVPKPNEDVEVEIVEIPAKDSIIKKKQPAHANEPCERFFGGIGINHSLIEDTVIAVHHGYPAEAAGIQVGDRIMSPMEGIRGEVGTEITVTVQRGGEYLIFTMIRDKICVDGGNPNGP